MSHVHKQSCGWCGEPAIMHPRCFQCSCFLHKIADKYMCRCRKQHGILQGEGPEYVCEMCED
jgi:hypothetical protein